jgi:hypothetical protein
MTRSIGAVIVLVRAARERAGADRLRFIRQATLVAWFFFFSYVLVVDTLVARGIPLGMDIRIYYRGVQNWLAGGDPWTANVFANHSTFSYAGSPATTILLAPSALLSEDQFTLLWLVLTALSAIAIVRWLRLPFWWLLFPPTAEALYSGNPQIVVLMLLLAGAGRAGLLADTVSVALKVYAWIPLFGERRWRRIGLALILTIATFAIAPSLWINYLDQFGAISARLAQESNKGFSAFYFPFLLVPTAIAILFLWRLDPRTAMWLAVPALWPSSEFHYSTFAQPVMTPMLSVLLAVPAHFLTPISITLYVVWRYASDPVHERLASWAAEWSASQPKAVVPAA